MLCVYNETANGVRGTSGPLLFFAGSDDSDEAEGEEFAAVDQGGIEQVLIHGSGSLGMLLLKRHALSESRRDLKVPLGGKAWGDFAKVRSKSRGRQEKL